jgi:signal transduction histidine kinase
VADDGEGIDPEDREQIFERGYSSDHQNTGLGLAIVQSAAEAHDWDVTVEESEAGGARFEFRGVEEPPE